VLLGRPLRRSYPMVYTMGLCEAERDLSSESVRPGRAWRQISSEIETGRGPYQNKLTEMLAYEAQGGLVSADAAAWMQSKAYSKMSPP